MIYRSMCVGTYTQMNLSTAGCTEIVLTATLLGNYSLLFTSYRTDQNIYRIILPQCYIPLVAELHLIMLKALV